MDLEAFKDAVKPKTGANFCLQRKPAGSASNHGNSGGQGDKKEDPFAFADNLTANFMKNKGHTRNRSWADSFNFLNLKDGKPGQTSQASGQDDKNGGKNSVSSSVTSSSRDSLHMSGHP